MSDTKPCQDCGSGAKHTPVYRVYSMNGNDRRPWCIYDEAKSGDPVIFEDFPTIKSAKEYIRTLPRVVVGGCY